MRTDSQLPLRGEVWRVALDPTVGAELRKSRPAIVISSDAVGKLPIKLIAPITTWKDAFAQTLWHIRIKANSLNGVTKTSAEEDVLGRQQDPASQSGYEPRS